MVGLSRDEWNSRRIGDPVRFVTSEESPNEPEPVEGHLWIQEPLPDEPGKWRWALYQTIDT